MGRLSTIKSALETGAGALKWWEQRKTQEHERIIKECAQRLKQFGDEEKRSDLRARFYARDTLRMQIIPHDILIDEVLGYMTREHLARQYGGFPDLWEIAPFVDTATGAWGG